MSGAKRLLAVVVVVAAVLVVMGVKSASVRKQAATQPAVTEGQLCPTPAPSTPASDPTPAVAGAAQASQPAAATTSAEKPAKPVGGKAAAVKPAKPAKPAQAAKPKVLPRLVDLGAKSCIPCKMMAGVLDELTQEYGGRLEVVFYDVYDNPQSGRDYGVRAIPTQVFFDTQGKEFFRHEGFMPKADILAKFKEHGINLGGGR